MSAVAPKTLPIPPLEHTVEGVVRAVGAVADASTLRATEAAARAFLAGPGPALQERLRQRAAREDAAGRSWLSAWWLRDYLAVREPLPLRTNVAFQINTDLLGPTRADPADARPGPGSGSADAASRPEPADEGSTRGRGTTRTRRDGPPRRPTSGGRRGSSTGPLRCTWPRLAGRPPRRRIPAATPWI